MIMARKILTLIGALLLLACSGNDSNRDDGARGVPPAAGDTGGPDDASPPPPKDDRRVVLMLGTSLTAGLGVSLGDAYPARLQERIDRAGLRFRVVNAGVSGRTSAGGLADIEWLLREPVAVLFLELGANDGLRGLRPDQMRANLQAIIDRTRERDRDVRVVIAGMEAPPNMGDAFTARFRRVFPDLARANRAALVPFLLEGVGGVAALNQDDGVHPTAEGHRRIAENVWPVLEPVLRAAAGRSATR
jgi:acyl-CoA thioesterase-1